MADTDSNPFPENPGRGSGRGARATRADRRQVAEHPPARSRIISLFRPYLAPIATVVTLIVATSLISMAQPFLVREIIDKAIPNQDVRLLVLIISAMLGITITTQLLGVVQTWISTGVGQRVMHALRTQVFDHLQRQSVGFFTRTKSGEVQSRLVNDISGMQSVVTSTATSIASNLTTAVATTVAMVALSWRLALLSLIVLPPAIWTTRKVAHLRREVTARQQERLADLLGQAEEGLSVSGIRLTKTLGLGPARSARFADASTELIDLELRSQLAGRWRMATMQIIFAAIPALIYLAAGLPATSGGMTIGTLIAFSALQSQIFRPIMGLLNVGTQWIASMALFSRVFGYLDLAPEVPEPSQPRTITPEHMHGAVTFDQVTMSYPGSPAPALSDISLELPAGDTLALVGPTGSGKSTLASLIWRHSDPDTGRILIDGIDIREISSHDLSRLVGVVSQEVYLVHDTIRANLLLARPQASEAQLWQALASAQIADMISSLPEGLDTVVGARGHRFSGGEQQRLAIARTVLRDPKILILDEATSALDTETERALQAALENLSRGRTTIAIAHRLSTIERADQIVVLDHGTIAERGTHEQLLSQPSHYAALHAA